MFRLNEPSSGITLTKLNNISTNAVCIIGYWILTSLQILIGITSSHSAVHAGNFEEVQFQFEVQNVELFNGQFGRGDRLVVSWRRAPDTQRHDAAPSSEERGPQPTIAPLYLSVALLYPHSLNLLIQWRYSPTGLWPTERPPPVSEASANFCG